MNYKLLLVGLLITFALNAQAKSDGIGAVFGALIGSAVGNAVGKTVGQRLTVDEALVKVVDQINKQLPRTVDSDTRWDATEAGPGRRFTYQYTIVAARAAEVDAAWFYQNMSSNLRNSVCTNQDMSVFFKNGVTVVYSYRGRDSRHITKIELSPQNCGFP